MKIKSTRTAKNNIDKGDVFEELPILGWPRLYLTIGLSDKRRIKIVGHGDKFNISTLNFNHIGYGRRLSEFSRLYEIEHKD